MSRFYVLVKITPLFKGMVTIPEYQFGDLFAQKNAKMTLFGNSDTFGGWLSYFLFR